MEQLVLDVFIFSCIAGGLRFGDLCTLKVSHLRKERDDQNRLRYRLSKRIRKNNRDLSYIIPKQGMHIIQKYIDLSNPDGFVFPILDKYGERIQTNPVDSFISSRNAYFNKVIKKIVSSTKGIIEPKLETGNHIIRFYGDPNSLHQKEVVFVSGSSKGVNCEFADDYLDYSYLELNVLKVNTDKSLYFSYCIGDVYDNTLATPVQSVPIGITKNVSFHIGRHTFATLALTKGMRIEVLKELLGHADIRETMIYAKIVDKKKDEAMALFD